MTQVIPNTRQPLNKFYSLAAVLLCLVFIIMTFTYQHWNLADDAFDAMRLGQFERAAGFLDEIVAKKNSPADIPENRANSNSGSGNAKLLLANLHYLGLGVNQDTRRAAMLYREAGLQGNSAAQYNLALMYHNGSGMDTDNIKAAAWFLLSDSAGNPSASKFLRTLSGQMNPNMIQQAHELQRQLGREIAADL